MIWATISMTFHVIGATNLDALTDEVFEALLALEGADTRLRDSDMDAVLVDEIVTVRVAAQGPTLDDAFDLGGSAIRSAIHSTGGATPGWKNPEPSTAPSSNFELRGQQLIPA